MYAPLDAQWRDHGGHAAVVDDPTETRHGRFLGSPVTVKEGASLLADAAEEVGLHLSERIERREQGLRRVLSGRSSRRLTIQEINDYLERSRQVPDPKSRELQIRTLLAGAQHPGDLLKAGGEWPETSTGRYLLLQQALWTAQTENASDPTLERLEQALADLEAVAGAHVQADLATIDHAVAYGESPQGITRFQTSLHTLLGKPTLVQAFKEILALADKDDNRLDRAVHHLIEALGSCLCALGNAREKVLLQALVTDLYHLKCLNTLFEEAQSVVRDVRRALQQSSEAQDPGHATAS